MHRTVDIRGHKAGFIRKNRLKLVKMLDFFKIAVICAVYKRGNSVFIQKVRISARTPTAFLRMTSLKNR